MIRLTRRSFAAALTGALTGAFAMASIGAAQAEYPDKPVTLIIPYKAGGSTETMGRVFAEALGDALGSQVIVRTRPGAGGAIGATEVAKAPADGYTLLFAASTAILWAPLTQDVDYGPEDFTYISQITVYQQAIVARADAPFNTFEELIAHAKDNRLNYADQGAVTKAFIDYLAKVEGVDWTGIPTKGGGEAMPFLLGGKVDFSYSGGVHSRYGDQMKVLMSLISERLAASPDVASIQELYGVAIPGQALIAGPAGLPADVVAKLEAAIAKAIEEPKFVELVTENLKFPIAYQNSADLTADIDRTNEGLKKVLEAIQ